ncbi:hypothetical protein A9Q99_05100 [Gammaproteobacteria bacterium 45_16_T64]|nr:hypothetical protein A9Q99_05100 [Gammaproteobacteria bacterium 45_16_T64]
MSKQKIVALFRKIDAKEVGLCLYFNRFSRSTGIRRFFNVVSRLGDGWIWIALMVVLPFIYGDDGWVVAMGMAIMATVNVLIYDVLKRFLARERPYISFSDVDCVTPPLDRYSFPSGHTLHAVSFTLVVATFFPILGILFAPFTILVGASRVILGLHYPTDVLMGIAIGIGISSSFVSLITYLISI